MCIMIWVVWTFNIANSSIHEHDLFPAVSVTIFSFFNPCLIIFGLTGLTPPCCCCCCCPVAKSSPTLGPWELQHARLLCPPLPPQVCSNLYSLSHIGDAI